MLSDSDPGGTMTNSTQKQMIVFITKDSPYFEEAHFILKEERVQDDGMVKEACRIISHAEARRIYAPFGKTKHRPPASRMTWFFMGVVTTLCIGSISALLISLLF